METWRFIKEWGVLEMVKMGLNMGLCCRISSK
jgi:hypothetical protein